MEKRNILQEGNYGIWRYNGIPQEAFEFLDRIAWGNDGAVYEHKNTEEHIHLLHNPTLMAIDEQGKMQGTAVFCNTPVFVGSTSFNCYYIRYFASSKEIRGKGVMKKYGVRVMESVREDEREKTVFFASVERGNRASYKAVESAGYEKIGVIKTIGFSRFFPRTTKNLEQITKKNEQYEVLDLLKKQYSDHALVQFNSIFLQDNYFVIRENGEIVAGCQVHKAHWVIKKMPGLMGKIVMNIVPLVPLLNKLFNPKKFEFLVFEGIFVKHGFEGRLSELFEGLLAKEKLKSAMYWLSSTCPIQKRIMEKSKTGLIHSFIKDSDVYIMASFHGLEKEEIIDLKSRPLFVSGFDYI
jgi:RimJ/RimL family protein N-acetyltransferase